MEKASIYCADGALRLETAVNEGSKRVRQLGGNDYALLKVTTAEPIGFRTGDYCDLEEEGRFYVVAPPLPDYDDETGGYRYEVMLEPGYRLWGNKTLLLNPGGHSEADFRLTAGIESHVRMVLKCVASHGFRHYDPATGEERDYDFVIGDDVTREARLVTYSGVDILTGLGEISRVFECEMWMNGGTVCLGRCENGDIMTFERGLNVSAIRASGREGKRPTRLIAFGGTENLPPYYRKRMVFTVTRREGDDVYDDAHPLRLRMLKKERHAADPSASLKTSELGGSASIGLGTGVAGEWLSLLKRETKLSGVKAGSWKLRLGNWRPEAVFDSPPKGTAHELRFRLRATWPGRDGKYEEHTAENVKGYFPVSAEKATWEDFDVNLAVDGDVSLTLEIDFKRGPGSVSGSVHVQSYGILEMDCYTNYCSAEGLTLDMEDGDSVQGVAFNTRHAPDTGSLPLTVPTGCALKVGDHFMVRDIVRLEIPGAWFIAEDGEAIADGVASSRLRLPSGRPYVDSREGLTDLEAIEHVEIFDYIFPRQDNVTQNVWEIDSEAVNADGSRNVERYYCLDWDGMDFGTDSIIEGCELRIQFTSGLLDGMTFGAVWHDGGIAESGWRDCLEIIANTDGGRMLPDTVLRPKSGDGFILLGVASEEVYDSLVKAAEEELLEKATEWLGGKVTEGETYECPMFAEAASEGVPGLGQRVRLVEPSLFPTGDFVSRVIGLEYALDIPVDSPVVTVGERIPATRLEGVEEKMREIGSLGDYETRRRSVYDVLSGITADLTNESDSVVFNALGTVVGDLPETRAEVWHDGERLGGVAARVVGDYHGLGFTTDGDIVRVTSADLTMEAETAVKVEARFEFNGVEETRELTFRIVRRRGDYRFQLMPTATAVHVGKGGGLDPASGTLVCGVVMTGAGAPVVLSDREIPDAGLTVEWSLDGISWNGGVPAYGHEADRIVFRLMEGDACIDMETVPFVRDGVDGLDGGDALVMDLDNEMATVVCDADGNVTAGLPVETVVSLYRGVKKLDADSLTVMATEGVSVVADKDSGLVSVTGIDHTTDDVVEVVITARVDDEDRTARLTIAKSRRTTVYGVTPDPATIKRGFTRRVRVGVTRSRGNYVEHVMTPLAEGSLWVRLDEGDWVEIIPGSEVDVAEVADVVSIHLCEGKEHDTSRLLDAETIAAVGDGKTPAYEDFSSMLVEDLITGSALQTNVKDSLAADLVFREQVKGKDGEDAYVVEAYTLTGDKIKNGEGSTDLYARVIKSGSVIEDSDTLNKQFLYTWRKYNKNGVAENWAGTSSSDKVGNPVRVTAEEINVKATFRCTVTRI